jgi:hypothetical protein
MRRSRTVLRASAATRRRRRRGRARRHVLRHCFFLSFSSFSAVAVPRQEMMSKPAVDRARAHVDPGPMLWTSAAPAGGRIAPRSVVPGRTCTDLDVHPVASSHCVNSPSARSCPTWSGRGRGRPWARTSSRGRGIGVDVSGGAKASTLRAEVQAAAQGRGRRAPASGGVSFLMPILPCAPPLGANRRLGPPRAVPSSSRSTEITLGLAGRGPVLDRSAGFLPGRGVIAPRFLAAGVADVRPLAVDAFIVSLPLLLLVIALSLIPSPGAGNLCKRPPTNEGRSLLARRSAPQAPRGSGRSGRPTWPSWVAG